MDKSEDAEKRLSAMMGDVNLSPLQRSANHGNSIRRERRLSDSDRAARSSRSRDLGDLFPDRSCKSSAATSDVPSTTEKATSSSSRTAPEEPVALQQHHCTSEECAVTTMFDTTELLEIVLDFLDTDSVLSLRLTSRRWNDVVRSSPTLRLHCFVRPQWSRPGADFQLLDLKLPGLSIEPGEDIEMGKWIQVSMTNGAARKICATDGYGRRVRSRSIFEGMRGGLGRRERREANDPWPGLPIPTRQKGDLYHEDLHITQPPVLGMQAAILDPEPFPGPSQSSRPPSSPTAVAKLHYDGGITLGFLAETTQSLLLDRSRRPEPDGRTVVYRAIVSFTEPSGAPRRRGTPRTVTRLA